MRNVVVYMLIGISLATVIRGGIFFRRYDRRIVWVNFLQVVMFAWALDLCTVYVKGRSGDAGVSDTARIWAA